MALHGNFQLAVVVFGAALLWENATQARFLQADPVGPKDDVNLYAYVRNDPLNDDDPTGRDAVVMNQQLYGGAIDHEALLEGRDGLGWNYQSKDGAAGWNKYAGRATYTLAHFRTLDEAMRSTLIAGRGYNGFFYHHATPQQDAIMRSVATREVTSSYNALQCNCGQAVGAALGAAGISHYAGNDPNPSAAASYMGSSKGGWTSFSPVALGSALGLSNPSYNSSTGMLSGGMTFTGSRLPTTVSACVDPSKC